MHADSVRLAVLLALYGGAGSATTLFAADVPAGRNVVRNPAGASALPIHVIDREGFDRSGLVSLGDFLQQLPESGATVNTRYNSGGDGSTQVDLRDLGAQRTLVLIDGRRFIQGLGGATDLNAIPLAAVERIEILTGGGAALYGADAVAGVVNVVLRHRFEGAEARAYLGEYEQGDGRTEAYDFTIGDAGERAGVLLNASYLKQEPVLAGDREISAVPFFGFPANDVNAGASSTTPFGRFGFGANGGRLPNGAPGMFTLIPGRSGATAADFHPFDARRDGFNFAPENYLATPQERASLYAHSRYALGESVAFRASALYHERRSGQQLAPFPLTLGLVGQGPLRVTIPATALYNPFGAAVTRAQFRPLNAPRSFRQDVDTFHFDAGFDGELEALGQPWSWSVGFRYVDTEQHDVSRGLFDAERLRAGLGPSFRDAGGVARCGTPAAVVAACVPLNIFGGPDGFTQEMFDYAAFVAQDTRYREQHAYHAGLTGELFELPAGPIAFAAGYEYGRESGFDQPDAFVASGASTGTQRAPTRGGLSSDDTFIELAVPLLQDVPLIESFALDVAARHSDYSTFSATTNVRYGFRWQPFSSLLLHGAYADGFRSPSISELFLGESFTFPNLIDPCAASQRPAGEVLARCRNGIGGVRPVPPGYEQHNGQFRSRVGGNPDLEPEISKTRTVGLHYRPDWSSGLDVWLDWTDLELRDVIGRASARQVLDHCYIIGNVDFCRHIDRDSSGSPEDTYAGYFNLPASVRVELWDLRLAYALAAAPGTFTLAWHTTYLDRHDTIRTVPRSEFLMLRDERAGLSLDRGAQYHRIKSNLTFDWQRGDFGATLGVRHLSALDEDCSIAVAFGAPQLCSNPRGSPQFSRGENRLDAMTYVDLQARWNTPWNAEIALGLRNALDEAPPVSFAATGGNFLPEYDLPGRFWYVALTQRF